MQNLQFLTKQSSRLDLHCLQKFGGEASVVPCAGDKSPIQTTLSIEYKGVKDSKKYTLVKFTRNTPTTRRPGHFIMLLVPTLGGSVMTQEKHWQRPEDWLRLTLSRLASRLLQSSHYITYCVAFLKVRHDYK